MRFLATSVVRGAELGQSHGGICLVNFTNQSVKNCLDWNTTEIDVEGRGGDRGLRGIAVGEGRIWVVSTDSLHELDFRFGVRARYCNQYLKHCHEVSLFEGRLSIVSTGFDAILQFDLSSRRFDRGYQLFRRDGGIGVREFLPEAGVGPAPVNVFHLNSVKHAQTGLYFAGLRAPALFRIQQGRLSLAANVPMGTHNAQPLGDDVLFNDTEADRVCLRRDGCDLTIDVRFERQAAEIDARLDPRVARPFFARGLMPLDDRFAVGGISPSTLCLYDFELRRVARRVAISSDVRNAIHGIAPWPGARE